MCDRCLLPSLVALAIGGAAQAQTIAPPFDASYSFVNLGSPPSVPNNLGGCAFKIGDPDALYLGGGAGGASGAVYRIGLTRNAQNDIVGFSGSAVPVATAANVDGGLEFGPGGVLFFTRYPTNEVGMIKPGSTMPDKIVALTPLGVPASVGSLRLVPAGFPGVGKLKLTSYNAGVFASADLQADAFGTYDLVHVSSGATTGGGPEGVLYVPPDSPQFVNFTSMLVCEYTNGALAAYTLDTSGDPVPATRRPFMTGLAGCEGAALDPVSGNLVFNTYGGGSFVLVVRGFGLPCSPVSHYGQGLVGSGGYEPSLEPVGCFARRQTVDFVISQGLGGAPGVFLVGINQIAVPILGGTLLVDPFTVVTHVLGGTGAGNGGLSLPLPIPNNTYLLNAYFYFQSAYYDVGATQSISFTRGLALRVR